MKEELIVSGRMNPKIDPILNIWHWEIPLYLFLGGLAAGILFFSSLYIILGKDEKYNTTVKKAPLIVPVLLIIGLVALLLDLNHKPYFWRLYTTIKFQSPMSWGAWTLMAVTPISFVWAALNIKEVFPNWNWKYKIIIDFEAWCRKQMVPWAWVTISLSVILGIYTGILLSAFNARPLWNTSILGPLFLTSGLSTGAAVNLILAKTQEQRSTFVKISLLLLTIELFFIVHMIMGFLASSEMQITAAEMFLGGEFTHHLWIFDVGLGIVIPASLEIIWLKKQNLSLSIPAALILFGGIMMRFTFVHAGQASRWLY